MQRDTDAAAETAAAPTGTRLARFGIASDLAPVGVNDDAGPDLAADLARATAQDELSLFFQPIVDLATGATAGYEVLLRWFHSTAGQVDPERIVRLAAEAGLSHDLTRATLARAAQTAARWRSEAFVAVNVSASQLGNPDLAEAVQNILLQAELPAHRLVVEVTEHEPIGDTAAACRTIASLRAAGVAVALDDFGQAHANLAAIKACCFDKLKLDRAFASSGAGRGATIQRAAAKLASALNISVVAEGLETSEQVQIARAAGCTHGQGHWFGRPMPASLLMNTPS